MPEVMVIKNDRDVKSMFFWPVSKDVVL